MSRRIFSAVLIISWALAQCGQTAAIVDEEIRASPSGPLRLGLQEALGIALENNPGLKAMDHRTRAAERRHSAASRSRWGEIDAFLNVSTFNDDWLVRPMSRQLFEEAGGFADLPWDSNQRHWGARFHLPLYLGGALKEEIRIAKLQTESVDALADGTRWHIRFNVTSLYTSAQALDQILLALDKQIAALAHTKEKLDLMVKVGKRPELDRLKIVANLEGTKAERARTAAERHKVGALLLAFLGMEPSLTFMTDPLPAEAPVFADDPASLQEILASSSVLRRAQFASDQAERVARKERGAFLPKISASGNYTVHDAPSMTGSLDTWEVSVGVSLPLFTGGASKERLHAAREDQAAARENLNQQRLDSAARLEEALAAFTAAQARIKAEEARVAAATEAARIEQIRFDTGAGAVEDLLMARAEEQSSRAAYAQALGDVRTGGERINTIVEKEVVQ